MSSVRPPDSGRAAAWRRLDELRRAASFRVALLFLALFGIISALLFVFLYRQMSTYALERSDDWLRREANSLRRGGDAELRERVDYHARLDPDNDRPFALYDAGGRRVAGVFPGPAPGVPAHDAAVTVPADFGGGRKREMRVYTQRLADGGVLLLSQNLHELHEFDELLLRALLAAGAAAAFIGLSGALLIGAGSLRRLDAMTRSIRTIVSGDLSQRLPLRARAGSGDDLDRLAGVVNGMLDDLERLMHEVKGVCDGIAHDLRTPLARLLAGLERAQRRAGSVADYELAVQAAVDETLALLATFNAMLRISEVEDGMRRGGFADLDLLAVADDVVEFYEPSAEEKDIAVQYARDPALRLPLRGDRSLLFEALGNLMDNAIKFTPPGGRIAITVLVEDGEVIGLRFADSGPGIAIEEREAVFLRFHRSESSRHAPGNGLGLSLVAAVARLHGIAVTIDPCDSGCQISVRATATPPEHTSPGGALTTA